MSRRAARRKSDRFGRSGLQVLGVAVGVDHEKTCSDRRRFSELDSVPSLVDTSILESPYIL